MKKFIFLLFALLYFSSSVKSQTVIRDSVFSNTLNLIGHSWDNAIIKYCTFNNIKLSDGIRIANANNLVIDSCVFHNIQGNGVRLHSSGISEGILIKNCSFDSIYGNGILAAERHKKTQILNNTFNQIGLDTLSASLGAPHHGIYFIGDDFLISGNRIQNIFNKEGNCVSVRSNGVVRSNILSGATKNGISYFSDHPAFSNTLLIENNIVYDCQRGVFIANGGDSYVDSTIIRFNTIITENLMNISIGSGLTMKVEIYGNILIRKDGTAIYIWADSLFNSTKNIMSTGDIGFVDFLNHDYHITNNSSAYSFASGLVNFPSHDFENQTRSFSGLDAGADQMETITGLQVVDIVDVMPYPNPATSEINIDLHSSENAQIEISNLVGYITKFEQNQNKIDISTWPQGMYVISVRQNQRVLYKKFVKQ